MAIQLVRLLTRLARAFESRPASTAGDHAPIDPSLLPIDLGARRLGR